MAALRRDCVVIPPDPRYTTVAGSQVAYQVVGDGPTDLVFVTGLVSHLDRQWEWPVMAEMLERMATYGRLIMFDRRGSGLSDPIALETLPTWEHWAEDLSAVLDAAGSRRSTLLGSIDGCFWSMLFAATQPERTEALILWNPWAHAAAGDDNPGGLTQAQLDSAATMWSSVWGTRAQVQMVGITDHVDIVTKYWRSVMTPRAAGEQMRYMMSYDLRPILPSIQVPTLVLRQKEWALVPIELSRYVADHIPGARYVEVPGGDGYAMGAEAENLIEDFLSEVRHAAEPDRVLATLLFTDIVGSTERASALGDRKWKEILAEHDRLGRTQVERFGGKLIKTTGDGIFATFAGPSRAIQCARALGRALRSSDIEIRSGLHTGEIELRDGGDVGGIAVHIAARVMAEAGPGEIVCSRTVKDLASGSGFSFTDRGIRALKGVPDEWQLFAVTTT
jgi:class 3 adenylate cyclase/alpha-beta hydrolase superfamily lysophospholipase